MGKASRMKRAVPRAERKAILKRSAPRGRHIADFVTGQKQLSAWFDYAFKMGTFTTVEDFVNTREKALKSMFKRGLRHVGALNKYSEGTTAVNGRNPRYVDLNLAIAQAKAKYLEEQAAKDAGEETVEGETDGNV